MRPLTLISLSLLLTGSLATSLSAWEFQDGVNDQQEFHQQQQQMDNWAIQNQLEQMRFEQRQQESRQLQQEQQRQWDTLNQQRLPSRSEGGFGRFGE